jgi:hypothetical protein
MQRPAAIYGSAPGRIDVFWVSLDASSVMQTWFDGSQWHTATVAKADGPFGLAPSAYADEPGRMDVGWTDGAGKIWYTQLSGGQWTTPSELNLSLMFAGKQGLPGPPNFNPGSPLIACNAANRRSHNAEFVVCDTGLMSWNFALPGHIFDDYKVGPMPFAPVQVQAQIQAPSPTPHLLWCDKAGMLQVTYVDWTSSHPVTTTNQIGGPTVFQFAVLEGLTPGRVDIFWILKGVSPRRVLMNTVWDGGKWSVRQGEVHDLHLDLAFAPVGGLQPGRVDVFWRSADGRLHDTWFGPQGGGIDPGGPPAVVSETPPAASYDPVQRRINVFWLGNDSNLHRTSFDGTNWTAPEVIGINPMMPAPAVISGYKPGRMDILWGGVERTLKQSSGDGTTWKSVMLNPGHMASAATVPSLNDSDAAAPLEFLEFSWVNAAGSVWYETFDGNWHLLELAKGAKSPPLICKLTFGPGFAASAPGGGVARFVYWVNGANQLCETCVIPGQKSWMTNPIDYTTRINRAAGAPRTNTPTFSSRFAPALLTGPTLTHDGIQLFVCDADFNLWAVSLNKGSSGPSYSGQNLHLGPLAYAPTAIWAPRWSTATPPSLTGLPFVFWCAKEDLSLRHSWLDQNKNWKTVTHEPGPVTSAPAIFISGDWSVHIFWRAQDGSLRRNWGSAGELGDAYRAGSGGWQTEIIDPGPVGSDLSAIENWQRTPYVFWLDSSGKLKQTSQNPDFAHSHWRGNWQTRNIAPATGGLIAFRDL